VGTVAGLSTSTTRCGRCSQSWQRSAPTRNASRAVGPRRACLWHNQGRCAEARDLLAPIYGWFTEGFDAPVLKEAKALLDELT
jgi:hypothetical protein